MSCLKNLVLVLLTLVLLITGIDYILLNYPGILKKHHQHVYGFAQDYERNRPALLTHRGSRDLYAESTIEALGLFPLFLYLCISCFSPLVS